MKWAKWGLAALAAAMIGVGLAWLACGQPVAAAARHAADSETRVVMRPEVVPFAQLPATIQASLTTK